jgi:predicted dehydrogenase
LGLRTPVIVVQVVNLEFSNGATASFTMVAYTAAICDRQTRLHFTNGELIGDMKTFTVTDFRTRQTTVHNPNLEGGGHGGGDLGLIRTFVEAVRTGNQQLLGTDIGEVLEPLDCFRCGAQSQGGQSRGLRRIREIRQGTSWKHSQIDIRLNSEIYCEMYVV